MKAFVQKNKKVILGTTLAVASLSVAVAVYVVTRRPVGLFVEAVVEAVTDAAE